MKKFLFSCMMAFCVCVFAQAGLFAQESVTSVSLKFTGGVGNWTDSSTDWDPAVPTKDYDVNISTPGDSATVNINNGGLARQVVPVMLNNKLTVNINNENFNLENYLKGSDTSNAFQVSRLNINAGSSTDTSNAYVVIDHSQGKAVYMGMPGTSSGGGTGTLGEFFDVSIGGILRDSGLTSVDDYKAWDSDLKSWVTENDATIYFFAEYSRYKTEDYYNMVRFPGTTNTATGVGAVSGLINIAESGHLDEFVFADAVAYLKWESNNYYNPEYYDITLAAGDYWKTAGDTGISSEYSDTYNADTGYIRYTKGEYDYIIGLISAPSEHQLKAAKITGDSSAGGTTTLTALDLANLEFPTYYALGENAALEAYSIDVLARDGAQLKNGETPVQGTVYDSLSLNGGVAAWKTLEFKTVADVSVSAADYTLRNHGATIQFLKFNEVKDSEGNGTGNYVAEKADTGVTSEIKGNYIGLSTVDGTGTLRMFGYGNCAEAYTDAAGNVVTSKDPTGFALFDSDILKLSSVENATDLSGIFYGGGKLYLDLTDVNIDHNDFNKNTIAGIAFDLFDFVSFAGGQKTDGYFDDVEIIGIPTVSGDGNVLEYNPNDSAIMNLLATHGILALTWTDSDPPITPDPPGPTPGPGDGGQVPEPSTFVMIILGIFGLYYTRRKRA
ncbi:MAG: PEP-CTERM sorting domain-containing protein [Planctomycetia bacterium]|nr:PEP-CTERM sorting domain-containing protein [Planctomycetia bacterium]